MNVWTKERLTALLIIIFVLSFFLLLSPSSCLARILQDLLISLALRALTLVLIAGEHYNGYHEHVEELLILEHASGNDEQEKEHSRSRSSLLLRLYLTYVGQF